MKRSTGLWGLTGCVVAVAVFMAWIPRPYLYAISGVHLGDRASDVHAAWPHATEQVDSKGRTWVWQDQIDYNAGARISYFGRVQEVVGYELYAHGRRFGDGDRSRDGTLVWEQLQKSLGPPTQHQAHDVNGDTDEYAFAGGLRVRLVETKGVPPFVERYLLGPDE